MYKKSVMYVQLFFTNLKVMLHETIHNNDF